VIADQWLPEDMGHEAKWTKGHKESFGMMAGGVIQVVECLPNKCETLSSNSSKGGEEDNPLI
jgi:hypothetical protein